VPNGRILAAKVALSLAALLLAASAARSADDAGQFAVRGAGLINCALFVQARATQDDSYLVTAAWVDGYVTGINQHAEETYDALSFESTELLMAILDEHCRKNPTDPVFGVITNLFSQLWPDRLTGKSEKVTVAVGEREARHYVDLIGRMQQALRGAGFYEGSMSGEFSPETMGAVQRFQESIGFEATGFPDQVTLWRLLREEEQEN
jgi:hypothetical protein